MVSLEGLELSTHCLERSCSFRLSYREKADHLEIYQKALVLVKSQPALSPAHPYAERAVPTKGGPIIEHYALFESTELAASIPFVTLGLTNPVWRIVRGRLLGILPCLR